MYRVALKSPRQRLCVFSHGGSRGRAYYSNLSPAGEVRAVVSEPTLQSKRTVAVQQDTIASTELDWKCECIAC